MKTILSTATAVLLGITFASTVRSQEPALEYNGSPIPARSGNHAFAANRKGMEGHWAQSRKFLEDEKFRAGFEANMNDADKRSLEAAVAEIKSDMEILKGYRSDLKMDRGDFMTERVIRDTATVHRFIAQARPVFEQMRTDRKTIMDLLKKYRNAPTVQAVYPNPVHVGSTSPTTFSYTLKTESDVKIIVSDANGRVIEEISKTQQSPGEHSVSLGPNFTKVGAYYVTIETGSTKNTQKVAVVE